MGIFKKNGAYFQKKHQLIIEFDEKRKLFTMSRRLVVVYSKVVNMGVNKIGCQGAKELLGQNFNLKQTKVPTSFFKKINRRNLFLTICETHTSWLQMSGCSKISL
jgi:hypothetical protein